MPAASSAGERTSFRRKSGSKGLPYDLEKTKSFGSCQSDCCLCCSRISDNVDEMRIVAAQASVFGLCSLPLHRLCVIVNVPGAAAIPNSCCDQSMYASPKPGSGLMRPRSHTAGPKMNLVLLG